MAIKTYLISCLIILANCNVRATKVADDCEESETASGGYFASGSAHSSQYLLPNGEVFTHSKGNSYSSGSIKDTFETLKQEANQFVSKQKDTVNIPNPLPPLHTGLDQDFHKIFDINNAALTLPVPSTAFNKFESASQQKKEIYGAGQNGQVYYQQVPIPQTSKVITKKTEYQEKKKVVTQGSSGLPTYGNEEIDEAHNGLESVNSGDTYFQHIPSSSFQNIHYQTGNSQKEIETLDSTLHQPVVPVQKTQKIQALPLSQTSFSKYETSVKQNSTSQVAPAISAYIPSNTFTTGIIDFTSNEGQNAQVSNLTPYLGNRVPSKITLGPEKHYDEEKETINYNQNVAFNTQTNTEQKEHKYNAVPLRKVAELPLKIKYTYDGKTLKKYEVYDAGVLKQVPISIEEYDNTLKEIKSQSFTQTSQYGTQSGSQVKDKETEGYYYPIQSQSLPTSNVHTFKKEESQSSHSHQTFTNADSSVAGNVEQFSHLPLNVDSQKQYNQGYVGVLAPASASQISEEKNTQATQVFANQPAILVRGVPQYIPLPSQQSSANSFQSSSHFSGSNTDFGYSPEFLNGASFDTESASSALHKLSTLNQNSGILCADCLGGLSASNVPAKSSYGVSTSFSSSSSNINGKKSENRHASVTVNDNGKVDTYNVKS